MYKLEHTAGLALLPITGAGLVLLQATSETWGIVMGLAALAAVLVGIASWARRSSALAEAREAKQLSDAQLELLSQMAKQDSIALLVDRQQESKETLERLEGVLGDGTATIRTMLENLHERTSKNLDSAVEQTLQKHSATVQVLLGKEREWYLAREKKANEQYEKRQAESLAANTADRQAIEEQRRLWVEEQAKIREDLGSSLAVWRETAKDQLAGVVKAHEQAMMRREEAGDAQIQTRHAEMQGSLREATTSLSDLATTHQALLAENVEAIAADKKTIREQRATWAKEQREIKEALEASLQNWRETTDARLKQAIKAHVIAMKKREESTDALIKQRHAEMLVSLREATTALSDLVTAHQSLLSGNVEILASLPKQVQASLDEVSASMKGAASSLGATKKALDTSRKSLQAVFSELQEARKKEREAFETMMARTRHEAQQANNEQSELWSALLEQLKEARA